MMPPMKSLNVRRRQRIRGRIETALNYKTNLKIVLVLVGFGLVFLSVIGTLGLMLSYTGLFPKQIPSSLALEILKGILQLNGFLVGFSGVIFAQLLRSLHAETNVHNEEVADSRSRSMRSKRRMVVLFMILGVLCYLFSIFYSLKEMA